MLRTALWLLVATLWILPACGRGEDRPGIVTADDDGVTSTTGPPSTTDEAPSYVPVSDVAADEAVVADVARLRLLLADDARVDWDAVTEIWRRGPDRIADVPEPTQLVDDAISGRDEEADDIRVALVRNGIDVVLGVRVREELAEAEARLDAGEAGDVVARDVDQAWVYLRGGEALAARGAAVEAALARGQDAAVGDDRAAFVLAAADAESALESLFYAATRHALVDAMAGPVALAAAESLYTAIRDRIEALHPAAHGEVVAAFRAGDRHAAEASLARPAVRRMFGG